MASPLNFTDFQTQLDDFWKEKLEKWSSKVWSEAGKVICKQGQASDCIYIIEDGVAEVVLESGDGTRQRNVAYLSEGDTFGEVGVLTGRNRSATVRAAVDVISRKIDLDYMGRMMDEMPGFAMFLAVYLAHRLAASTDETLYQSHCKQLRGTLPQFDLMVVMQTIRDSNADGELLVWSADDALMGAMLMKNGVVTLARCAHLKGPEAVWELLCDTTTPGRFAFRLVEEVEGQYDEDCKVGIVLTDCLMDGALKRDYFDDLPEGLRFLAGTLAKVGDSYSFKSETRQLTADRIWSAVSEGEQQVAYVWKMCEVSSLTFGQVIQEMIESGMIIWKPSGR